MSFHIRLEQKHSQKGRSSGCTRAGSPACRNTALLPAPQSLKALTVLSAARLVDGSGHGDGGYGGGRVVFRLLLFDLRHCWNI